MTEDPDRPRVLVFGAGAVGSLLGGILSGAGYAVTLLGRGPSIDVIQQSGLSVQLHDRHFQTHPAAISSLTETSDRFDVVLLTVRSFAVEAAINSLSDILDPDTTLVTLQNGIGTEELVSQRLPGIPHVAGSLTLSADAGEPGEASSSSASGGISLAPVLIDWTDDAKRVAEMFRAGGIPVSTHDDYRAMKWSKLLLNQMANGIPAILDWTPGQVYRNTSLFRIEHALLRETLAVMSGLGLSPVALPGFPVPLLGWSLRLPSGLARRLLLKRVEGGRGSKLPSLLIDLRAGHTQIEASWLYGAVAEAGKRTGIPTPLNRRVCRILESIAANQDLRESFRNRPDLLMRNMELASHA